MGTLIENITTVWDLFIALGFVLMAVGVILLIVSAVTHKKDLIALLMMFVIGPVFPLIGLIPANDSVSAFLGTVFAWLSIVYFLDGIIFLIVRAVAHKKKLPAVLMTFVVAPVLLFICGLIAMNNEEIADNKADEITTQKLDPKTLEDIHETFSKIAEFQKQLDNMYGFGSSSQTPPISQTKPKTNTPPLSFSNVKISQNSSSNYTICTGTVTNNTSRTFKFLQLKGSFTDSIIEGHLGTVIDIDWTYVVGSEGLGPHESSTFRLSVPKDYRIQNCVLSIIDYS